MKKHLITLPLFHRLRERLDQLEKQEKEYEEDIERLKDELAIQRELNAEHEQAILNLQADKTAETEIRDLKKEVRWCSIPFTAH